MRVPRGSLRWQAALLISHTVTIQAVAFVLRPTATYRAIELDVPVAWLGALSACFAVVPLVLAVPSGQAVDRLGERRVMLGGAILVLASAATFVLAGSSVAGLVAASVLLGTGHLCSVVGEQALVANTAEPSRYDAVFGRYTFAVSVGQALGPGLIIVFGGAQPIPATGAIFVGTGGLTLLLLVNTVLLRPPVTRGPDLAGDQGGVRRMLRRPGLLRALTVSCLVLAAVDILLVYLPALGAERGIASGAVGVLLTVRAVASMVSRFFLGRLSAALGRRRLLVGSITIAAVGLGISPVPMPVWLLGVVLAAVGFGLGAGQPLTMSWLAEATPAGQRGRAMSLRLTGNRVGQVLVPTAAGLLSAGAGATGVLALTAAGLAAAAVAARRLQQAAPPESTS